MTTVNALFNVVSEVPPSHPAEAPIADLEALAQYSKDNPGQWVSFSPPRVTVDGKSGRNVVAVARAEINSGRSREFGTGYVAQTRNASVGNNPEAVATLYVKYVGDVEFLAHQRTGGEAE